jgi:hypothetical protein
LLVAVVAVVAVVVEVFLRVDSTTLLVVVAEVAGAFPQGGRAG